LCHDCQKAGQKQSKKIAKRSFEDVEKFKYLRTTLSDKNCMQEEIKSRINSGNAYCHSVQSLLSSGPLSRNVKVKMSPPPPPPPPPPSSSSSYGCTAQLRPWPNIQNHNFVSCFVWV
jgi:hypothetical protein